jgi:hypothetical protein
MYAHVEIRYQRGSTADGDNSAYDTVTDRIWDSINKGVRSFDVSSSGVWTDLNYSVNGRISGRDTSRMRVETMMNRSRQFEERKEP